MAAVLQGRRLHGVHQPELDDVDRDLRVVARAQLLPDEPFQRRGVDGRGFCLVCLVLRLVHDHGSLFLFSFLFSPAWMAAFSVCQARLAHLTRTGKALTPEKAASLPSASRSKQGSCPPVTI